MRLQAKEKENRTLRNSVCESSKEESELAKDADHVYKFTRSICPNKFVQQGLTRGSQQSPWEGQIRLTSVSLDTIAT